MAARHLTLSPLLMQQCLRDLLLVKLTLIPKYKLTRVTSRMKPGGLCCKCSDHTTGWARTFQCQPHFFSQLPRKLAESRKQSSMTLKMQKAQGICLIHLCMQHALGNISIGNRKEVNPPKLTCQSISCSFAGFNHCQMFICSFFQLQTCAAAGANTALGKLQKSRAELSCPSSGGACLCLLSQCCLGPKGIFSNKPTNPKVLVSGTGGLTYLRH